jgi:hypothetical protein
MGLVYVPHNLQVKAVDTLNAPKIALAKVIVLTAKVNATQIFKEKIAVLQLVPTIVVITGNAIPQFVNVMRLDYSLKKCPKDWSNRGLCKDGQCLYLPSFRGESCSKRTCPNSCSYNGICDKGTCQCDPGLTGDDFSIQFCLNKCSNNGTCINNKCILKKPIVRLKKPQ